MTEAFWWVSVSGTGRSLNCLWSWPVKRQNWNSFSVVFLWHNFHTGKKNCSIGRRSHLNPYMYQLEESVLVMAVNLVEVKILYTWYGNFHYSCNFTKFIWNDQIWPKHLLNNLNLTKIFKSYYRVCETEEYCSVKYEGFLLHGKKTPTFFISEKNAFS